MYQVSGDTSTFFFLRSSKYSAGRYTVALFSTFVLSTGHIDLLLFYLHSFYSAQAN